MNDNMVSRVGVLVVAHGSSNPQWVRGVEQAVAGLSQDFPIAIGHLEKVPGQSIADAVSQLEQQGVQRIAVVPLLVSSGSAHLEEIKYILGFNTKCYTSFDHSPVKSQAEFLWCGAMDDHPYVVTILRERVNALSCNPQEEAILLVAHGSRSSGSKRWEQMLVRLTDKLRENSPFAEVSFATIYPDNITARAAELAKKYRLLVVPVSLSRGYITNRVIPGKLENISCEYNGETYLPHPLIGQWIKERAISVLQSEENEDSQ